MKVAYANYNVRAEGLSNAAEMRILHNGKMFEMLAGLYSDVAKAIWRELIANADDANRSIGQTRPFQVALPSDLEPSILIRDFGPGMSHEFMMGGYTWVGHSTKAETNGQIGGFGLGRLAPIAYQGATAYTVTSITDKKRVYAVYRNDKGVPTVALASEEDTDQPTGVEIRVPVLNEDRDLFARKLQEVLQWFDPSTYEVFGGEIKPLQVTLRAKTYIDVADLNRNHVLMGPVAYQIDWSQIGEELPTSVVPVFEIGELDLPPSREQVSYSPTTLAAMRKVYDTVANDLVPRTLREAYTMTPVQRLELLERLSRSRGLDKLFSAYHKVKRHRAKDAAAKKTDLANFKPKWGKFLLYDHERIVIPGKVRKYYGASRRSNNNVSTDFVSSDKLEFTSLNQLQSWSRYFLMDVGGTNPRIRDRLEATNISAGEYCVVFDEEAFAKLQEIKPNADYRRLSDYEPYEKAKAAVRYRHHVYREGYYHSVERDGMMPSSGVYVPFTGKEPEPRVGQPWRKLAEVAWAKDIEFYGFSKTARRIVGIQDFELLDVWLKKKAAAALKDERVLRALAAADTLAKAEESALFDFVRARAEAGLVDVMPKAVSAMAALLADLIDNSTVASLRQLAAWGWVKLPKPRDYHRVLPALAQAEKRNEGLIFLLNSSRQDLLTADHPILRKVVK